jgi:hypothetical protein
VSNKNKKENKDNVMKLNVNLALLEKEDPQADKQVEQVLTIDPDNLDVTVNMDEIEEAEDEGPEEVILKTEDFSKVEKKANSTIQKIQELTAQSIPAKFRLTVLPYKKTACSIPSEFINYLEKETDHLVSNSLQKAERDPGRISVVHLLEIIYTVLGIPHQQYKQSSGTSTSWGIKTDKSLNVKDVTEHSDYKMLRAMGFKYDEVSRKASFYLDDSNIEYLKAQAIEDVEQVYNRVIEALKKTHALNSHNNMMTEIKDRQRSSFLILLNKLMQAI